MKKLIYLLLIILIGIVGCEPQVSYSKEERLEIVEWAKQIAKYENDADIIFDNYYALTNDIASHYPSNEELNKLTTYYNLINYIYNEISKLNPPPKVSSTHAKFVENYAKASDSIMYYIISIRQNDMISFEKSVSASKESNRIHDDAYYEFIDFLEHFSIPCNEVDFCE